MIIKINHEFILLIQIYKVVHYHERTVLGGQQHPAFDMPPLHTPILLPSSFL